MKELTKYERAFLADVARAGDDGLRVLEADAAWKFIDRMVAARYVRADIRSPFMARLKITPAGREAARTNGA